MSKVTLAKRLFTYSLIIIGSVLTLINLYGLTQSIRPDGLWDEPTRFNNDYSIPYEESLEQLKRLPEESESEFAQRITHVIAQSITHIHWNEEPDNTRFHQLIPIWENYFLYFMGKFSGIPEYEKYHFADYRRSLKRGIGVCGDTSMIMSQVLDDHGIENEIMILPEHVVLKASPDGVEQIFDADFGVSVPYSAGQVKPNIEAVVGEYAQQGYDSEADYDLLQRIFSGNYIFFDDVRHFITNKYYFEHISYGLKWPLPITLFALGLLLLLRKELPLSR